MVTYRRFIMLTVLFTILPIIGSAQIERWVYRYSGVNAYRDDEAHCLVYGADGNIYAGGYTYNDSTNRDFTVISLTNAGSERWVYKYPTLGNKWDECNSICYGSDGNIYAIGNCTGSDSLHHFTIISLTTNGTERWIYQYPQSSSANSLCFGADGNVYAVGSTQGKILVICVDTSGAENWHYIYPTPSAEAAPGRSITYGIDGNIYVAGHSGPVWNTDVTVISLTTLGEERWIYLYNGPGGTYDYGECIVYGPDGNLYIFGSTCYLVGPGYVYSNGLAISLTTSGSERWTYISPADPSGFGCGIFGADGNLYAAGAYGWDIPFFLVESVTDSGTYRWQYIDTQWSYAHAIVYGDDANIYTAGIVYDTCYNFVVICFKDTGSIIWRYNRHDGESTTLTFSTDGNIYAAGRTWDNITGADFTVISLNSTGIEEGEGLRVEGERIKLMVLPSVVRGYAKIQYTIPTRQQASLNIYDVTGCRVKRLVDGFSEPGCYKLNWDGTDDAGRRLSEGVYFIRLDNQTEVVTQKIIILR